MRSLNYRKCWNFYSEALRAGKVPLASQAVFSAKRGGALGFLSSSDREARPPSEMENLAALLGIGADDKQKLDNMIRRKEQKLFELGMEFLEASKSMQVERVAEIAGSGFNVNFRHPMFDYAAIHQIARPRLRALVHAFLKADNIDYLLKDREGRTASVIAKTYHNDRVLHRFFETKERQQARAQGIDWDVYVNS